MEKTDQQNRLGQHLEGLRRTAGLSLREVARRTGVTATWVMRVERGEYVEPDPKRLAAVAGVLQVEAIELYRLAGYPAELPTMQPYLRSKYGYLPPEAIDQLAAHFELINEKYQPEGEGGQDGRNHRQSA